MKFFAHTNVHCLPKNKAQKEAQELAQALNGTLIIGKAALDDCVETVIKQIHDINDRNKRCTDLHFSRYFYEKMGERSIHVDDCFGVSFLEVKQEIGN